MAHRPDLNSLNAADRQALVNLMMQYLTDAIVAEHLNIIHSGVELFTGHDAYIAGMEAFLSANGGGQFVLLPTWNPATPIPAEFNIVKAQDNGTPRPPLQNLNPNRPKPPEFEFPAVCDFDSADELGDAVNPWHGGVHIAVGGTMGNASIASAAPIFWCWHGFVNEIYWDWQRCRTTCPNITGISVGLARLRLRVAGLAAGNVTRLPRFMIRPELLERFMTRPEIFEPVRVERPFRRVLDFDGQTPLNMPRRIERLLADGPRVVRQFPEAGTSLRRGSDVDVVVLED